MLPNSGLRGPPCADGLCQFILVTATIRKQFFHLHSVYSVYAATTLVSFHLFTADSSVKECIPTGCHVPVPFSAIPMKVCIPLIAPTGRTGVPCSAFFLPLGNFHLSCLIRVLPFSCQLVIRYLWRLLTSHDKYCFNRLIYNKPNVHETSRL
jgi:hypothetical protein